MNDITIQKSQHSTKSSHHFIFISPLLKPLPNSQYDFNVTSP